MDKVWEREALRSGGTAASGEHQWRRPNPTLEYSAIIIIIRNCGTYLKLKSWNRDFNSSFCFLTIPICRKAWDSRLLTGSILDRSILLGLEHSIGREIINMKHIQRATRNIRTWPQRPKTAWRCNIFIFIKLVKIKPIYSYVTWEIFQV